MVQLLDVKVVVIWVTLVKGDFSCMWTNHQTCIKMTNHRFILWCKLILTRTSHWTRTWPPYLDWPNDPDRLEHFHPESVTWPTWSGGTFLSNRYKIWGRKGGWDLKEIKDEVRIILEWLTVLVSLPFKCQLIMKKRANHKKQLQTPAVSTFLKEFLLK